MRDIGNAAEELVKSWCALSDITTNKAVIDRYGWDLLFEMPSGFGLNVASGLHQSAYECKVQVKATDGGPKSLPIELSNLHSMATTALPSFYLFLDFDRGSAPKAAYLIHLDESLCSKILERIRIVTTEDARARLNKKTMSLNFSEAPTLESLDGEGLKKAIVDCIGRSQSDYVTNKQRHLSSAGYENGAISVRFTVAEQDIKNFVGMAIGDNTAVQVKDFKSFSTRFGIKDQIPFAQSATALISIADLGPREIGRIVARNPRSGARVEWEADVYRLALGLWVPEAHRKMRMRATRFTIDIRPDGKELTLWFHKKDKDPSTVPELAKHYQFLTLMQDPEGVQLSLHAAQRELNATVSISSYRVDYSGALQGIKDIQKLQNDFYCGDELAFSPNELAEKIAAVGVFQVVSNEGGSEGDQRSTITASIESGGVDFVQNVVPCYVQLGDIHFVSLVLLKGELIRVGNDYQMDNPSRTVIYKTYCRDNVESLNGMLNEIQACANGYRAENADIAVVEQFEEYLRALIFQREARDQLGA